MLVSATQGVKVGDKVAEFGSVTAANFTGLRNVADVVQHSVGVCSPLPPLLVICVDTHTHTESSACSAGTKRTVGVFLPHSSPLAWTRSPRVCLSPS